MYSHQLILLHIVAAKLPYALGQASGSIMTHAPGHYIHNYGEPTP